MIDVILFDMDGVLVDSEMVQARAVSDTLVEAGLAPLTPDSYDRFFFGRTDYSGFSDYLRAIGRPDLDVEEMVRRKADAYHRRFPREVLPLDDGLETLRAAARAGYRVAIVTGGLESDIALVVQRFDLASVIAATVSGDEVRDGKPNPEPYLLGARRLGVPPEQCLVVEDAPAGVEAARRAGMCCLAVDRLGQPERLAHADRVVQRLTLAAVEDTIRACQA